ncbi:MAG: hypothetical protein NMNS01_11820 [Nitrosomonas sp.]|nr:MAG: hypothetical protein NMNS01_11820 [Nitrosomonas sp.]
MGVITSAAPIVFLSSGMADGHVVSALDAMLINYSPLSFLVEDAYAASPLNVQIVIAATSPVFVSLTGTLGLSFRKVLKLANMVMYLETKKDV